MAFLSSLMPPASSIFAAYASATTFIMMLQTMLKQLIPASLQQYIISAVHHYLWRRVDSDTTVIIEENDDMITNEVYGAAELYLCTKNGRDIQNMKISKRYSDTDFRVRFAQSESVVDSFQGIRLVWKFVEKVQEKPNLMYEDSDTGNSNKKRHFKLCFDTKHKATVLETYVPYILEWANSIRSKRKVIKLHTLSSSSCSSSISWDRINLEHPSTFETLAMEPAEKKCIIEDLDRFLRRKEFYRKVGRAWKRGYLLYGPPGTGKSSLIAAMANYLKFDIYDLELSNVRQDSDLRKVLLRTANKSILVIEDIDCTVKLPNRNCPTDDDDDDDNECIPNNSTSSEKQFTLSALLNFIDGLWSSCGDERIIIFTTNKKEKLDPALLRPGRMDMHIHMSYLTPAGFKLLASTYLNVNDPDHPRFPEIEGLIEEMKVTPAEVAEELMKSDNAETSLEGLLNFLKCKKTKNQ
ncbi:AAA-ATPase At5g17760-like isoform X2 [Andrographis paniculata]|uniref:AAA-ATPase At5g17760-like isoform X2 n=1 Tax=Andrographis paniculata TaxID=175694 RepID=UPI0021E88E98|nr:AAA-ATPase At5g17760-like isoform X2 [Andrographis paniculata]